MRWEKGPTLPGEGCTPAQRRLADDKALLTSQMSELLRLGLDNSKAHVCAVIHVQI